MAQYRTLSFNIAAKIDLPFEIQFKGGKLTADPKDSLASLLILEESVFPLRKHTVNTVISRFLGVL